jgi:hypothetical protein
MPVCTLLTKLCMRQQTTHSMLSQTCKTNTQNNHHAHHGEPNNLHNDTIDKPFWPVLIKLNYTKLKSSLVKTCSLNSNYKTNLPTG